MTTTYTWAHDASGAWTDSANWMSRHAPSRQSATALIAQTGTAYEMSISDKNISIGTLLMESAAGILTLSDGTLDANTIKLTAGTISVDARSQVSADAASFNDALIINGGTVNAGATSLGAHGTIDFTAGGSLAFGGTLATTAGALIEVTSGEAYVGTGSDRIGNGGTILANGGTLLLDTRASGNTVTIGNALGSEIDITGSLSYGDKVGVDFLRTSGTFAYRGFQGHVTFDVSGLNAAATRTNVIDLEGPVYVLRGDDGSGSNGTVVLSNGDTIDLSHITQQTGSAWQVETTWDGAWGTDIWLKAVCYAGGTNLLTPDGERPVEDLREGDLVVTMAGDQPVVRRVRWIGWRRIDLARHPEPGVVAPVRIRRGAIAEQIPHRDLLVSPDHAIYLQGQLVAARQLINGGTIRQETDWPSVDYYHVELDEHCILLAEGLTAESYLDTGNRDFFANGSEHPVLHPNLTSDESQPQREASSCAPFIWQEDDVRPLWQHLADRAQAQGCEVITADITTDPALRVLVDGRPVQPIQASPGHCAFPVPAGATSVRILSRASAPTDARPWHNDCRRRGVRLHRIVLRQGSDLQDVPLDHPSLCEGWLAVERGGSVMRRWTSGDAELRLLPSGTMSIVELRFDTDALEYVLPREATALAA